MPNSPKNLISIGRIGSPHGVKGWLKVNSFTEPPANILSYEPWLIVRNGNYLSTKVINSRQQDKIITVQLEGCHDRDLAATYTNCEIVTERSRLKTLAVGEYYWADLEGLNVVTKEGDVLGRVDSIMATGANDVLVIAGTKRHLIPFLIPQVVLSIDLDNQQMVVDWDPNF